MLQRYDRGGLWWRGHRTRLKDQEIISYIACTSLHLLSILAMCRKCAKVCRAPEKGKSHEESCDSSWDFGALEGTRIPGPLIKSQMLYRLSYERIFCGKTIPPNNITTIGCKKQERHLKKRKFQFYTTKLLKKPLRPALQQLHQQAGIDADHRGRFAQIHGLALGQVG